MLNYYKEADYRTEQFFLSKAVPISYLQNLVLYLKCYLGRFAIDNKS